MQSSTYVTLVLFGYRNFFP